jgi:uncharacterized membrane protein
MKIRNKLVDALIIISLLGLLVIIFIPISFPMQICGDGRVARWGDRIEFLIYSMFPIVFGIITKVNIAYKRKKLNLKKSEHFRNEKPLLTSAIIFMVLFDLILCYIIVRGYTFISTGSTSLLHFMNVPFGILGIVVMLVGNYMPIIEYDSMIGFKNTWSIANENSWELTHRFLGKLYISFGFILIIFSFLTKDESFSGPLFISIVLIIVVISYALSYIAYRRTK